MPHNRTVLRNVCLHRCALVIGVRLVLQEGSLLRVQAGRSLRECSSSTGQSRSTPQAQRAVCLHVEPSPSTDRLQRHSQAVSGGVSSSQCSRAQAAEVMRLWLPHRQSSPKSTLDVSGATAGEDEDPPQPVNVITAATRNTKAFIHLDPFPQATSTSSQLSLCC